MIEDFRKGNMKMEEERKMKGKYGNGRGKGNERELGQCILNVNSFN